MSLKCFKNIVGKRDLNGIPFKSTMIGYLRSVIGLAWFHQWCSVLRMNSGIEIMSHPQVLPWRVHGGSVHQRLPGHLLSILWGGRACWAHGALRVVHGELWWLHKLRPQEAGLQTLGMQPSTECHWSTQVLWEVPAIHSLQPRLRVSTWTWILLRLWVLLQSTATSADTITENYYIWE